MELSEKQKQQILQSLMAVFKRIENKEYQKRIWIEGKGPECDDFTDTACDFFIEGDPMLENYKKFGISGKQHDLLLNFRNKFEIFSEENNDPEFFIDTPEWDKIRQMAKELLEAFSSDSIS